MQLRGPELERLALLGRIVVQIVDGRDAGPHVRQYGFTHLLGHLQAREIAAHRSPDVMVCPPRQFDRRWIITALARKRSKREQHTAIEPLLDGMSNPDRRFAE